MRMANPQAVKARALREPVVFAGSQLLEGRNSSEVFFSHYHDECFVIADGGRMPHGTVASRLAGEAAIWAYTLVRQRRFYWADKKSFLRRIFRSSNLTVWQKRRESGFEDGLATTLSVAMVGPNNLWVGTVGNTNVLLYRDGLIDEMTPPDVDDAGRLTNALGIKRLGLVPNIAVDTLLPGDILVMATDGVMSYVSEDQVRATCEITGDTRESLMNAVTHLLRTAETNGSPDTLSAFIIKKIHPAIR